MSADPKRGDLRDYLPLCGSRVLTVTLKGADSVSPFRNRCQVIATALGADTVFSRQVLREQSVLHHFPAEDGEAAGAARRHG